MKYRIAVHSLHNRSRLDLLARLFCIVFAINLATYAQADRDISSNLNSTGLFLQETSIASQASNGAQSIELSSTLNDDKAAGNGRRSCNGRLVVNVTLSVLTAASVAGYIIADIRSKRLLDEFGDIHDTRSATSNEIEWERIRAARNTFGVMALGSSTVLAVSLVIPIGRDDCSGCIEKRIKKDSSGNRKEKKS